MLAQHHLRLRGNACGPGTVCSQLMLPQSLLKAHEMCGAQIQLPPAFLIIKRRFTIERAKEGVCSIPFCPMPRSIATASLVFWSAIAASGVNPGCRIEFANEYAQSHRSPPNGFGRAAACQTAIALPPLGLQQVATSALCGSGAGWEGGGVKFHSQTANVCGTRALATRYALLSKRGCDCLI